ncbi:unnamed protein product [Symbiodinium natans]|uniref:Uncharacterized protein n=1 Tax=Symbiodinium natans TaxID=878477 RepID=A0A812K6D9_9DINO|nr:unnamed protein product [Symbiodinium natans]
MDFTRSRGFDLSAHAARVSLLNFMQRLKHDENPYGIHYDTLQIGLGWQSTVTVTCEAVDGQSGCQYEWSGKSFRGEVAPNKAGAEDSAASCFVNDPQVQATAAGLEPAKRRVDACHSQWNMEKSRKKQRQ